jgi:hypothetical protein
VSRAPAWGSGEGARAIYYCWVSESLVLMMDVYAKSEQEDLNAADKKALTKILETFKEDYDEEA